MDEFFKVIPSPGSCTLREGELLFITEIKPEHSEMMENPEEVLQALDEFQKMRPSEIPKELEDYLCFVAKTGDPVYQWSLIKALFREKLMRVMTEFYESCPTPDLTACPNVEQFNYDIMKKNLLDKMESFVNAPFTVQRICELLTSPRKEYNRIDKFMRAIEKNILVVSTKDPGPPGRRSENGDSLVNGSLEDDTTHHTLLSTTKLEEVDSWEKTCAETTAVLLQMEDSEELTLERTTNALLKNSFGKSESITGADGTASTFMTSTGDFSTTTTTQMPVSEISAVVQNLTASDVADAIMNEDTSSQPSLELESDDSNSNDSKKLQTTFQAKDFNLEETESSKTFAEETQDSRSEENIENIDGKLDTNDQQSIKSYSSEELSNDSASDSQNSLIDKTDEPAVSEIENEVEKRIELPASETSESTSDPSLSSSQPVENDNLEIQKDSVIDNVSTTSVNTNSDNKVIVEENKVELIESAVSESISVSIDSTEKSEEICPVTETEGSSEVSKPIVEESSEESTITTASSTQEPEHAKVMIEEAALDDSKPDIAVSDPLPTVEETKDPTIEETKDPTVDETKDPTVEGSTSIPIVPEVETSNVVSEVKNGLDSLATKLDQVEDNQMLVTSCDETPTSKGITEWMDIDSEASQPSDKDEPMEQEIVEALNS